MRCSGMFRPTTSTSTSTSTATTTTSRHPPPSRHLHNNHHYYANSPTSTSLHYACSKGGEVGVLCISTMCCWRGRGLCQQLSSATMNAKQGSTIMGSIYIAKAGRWKVIINAYQGKTVI